MSRNNVSINSIREKLHALTHVLVAVERSYVHRSLFYSVSLQFEVFTLAGRCYLRTAQTEDLSTLRVKFALLPDGTAIVSDVPPPLFFCPELG